MNLALHMSLIFLILVFLLSDLTLNFVITWNFSMAPKLNENISVYEHKSPSCLSFPACFYFIFIWTHWGFESFSHLSQTVEPLVVPCSSWCSRDAVVHYFSHSQSHTQSPHILLCLHSFIYLWSEKGSILKIAQLVNLTVHNFFKKWSMIIDGGKFN